jgi:hypothetical protein
VQNYRKEFSVGSSRHTAAKPVVVKATPNVSHHIKEAYLAESASKVTCFRNGTMQRGVAVVARTLESLLADATTKLALPFAARRVFDRFDHQNAYKLRATMTVLLTFARKLFSDGKELFDDFDVQCLTRGSNVFISQGTKC